MRSRPSGYRVEIRDRDVYIVGATAVNGEPDLCQRHAHYWEPVTAGIANPAGVDQIADDRTSDPLLAGIADLGDDSRPLVALVRDDWIAVAVPLALVQPQVAAAHAVKVHANSRPSGSGRRQSTSMTLDFASPPNPKACMPRRSFLQGGDCPPTAFHRRCSSTPLLNSFAASARLRSCSIPSGARNRSSASGVPVIKPSWTSSSAESCWPSSWVAAIVSVPSGPSGSIMFGCGLR